MKFAIVAAILILASASPLSGGEDASSLIPRQASVLLDLFAEWVCEAENTAGEAAAVDLQGSVSVDETGEIVATSPGVVVHNHGVSGSLYHVAFSKFDEALGMEGYAEVFVNRFTRELSSSSYSVTAGVAQNGSRWSISSVVHFFPQVIASRK